MSHARIESSRPWPLQLAKLKEENQARAIRRSHWFVMAVERRVIKSQIVDTRIAGMMKMILARIRSGAKPPERIVRRTHSQMPMTMWITS
jgi:hypothetical protein